MGAAGLRLSKSRYPTEKRPDHPLAWPDGRVRIHQAVLYDVIGPGTHPCWRCGKTVEWRGDPPLHVDHLDGDTWNNDPSNLAPACSRCNTSRHNLDATHCRRGHEWSQENTYWRQKSNGRRTRQCLACQRIRDEKFTEKGYRRGTYKPKRIGLNPSGMTLGDLREWVESMSDLPEDAPIFITRKKQND